MLSSRVKANEDDDGLLANVIMVNTSDLLLAPSYIDLG